MNWSRLWVVLCMAMSCLVGVAQAQTPALVVQCPVGVAPDPTVPQIVALPIAPTTRLCWTHDQATDRFEIRVNGTKVLEATPLAGVADVGVPFPALSAGDHVVIVAACRGTTCLESAPTTFRLQVAAPTPPGGLQWSNNTVSWEHAGANTHHYELLDDTTVIAAVGVVLGQARQAATVTLDPLRSHRLTVRACATSGSSSCVPSEPLLLPSRPLNLRLGQ